MPLLDRQMELRFGQVEAKRRAVADHIASLRWSAEQIKSVRRDRLRALLQTAKSGSVWHRARLAHVSPAEFEEKDIRTLPVMTKRDVMTHFNTIVTDGRVTLRGVEAHLASLTDNPEFLLDQYHAVASGGSTGVRGVFVYDWDAWITCYAGWFRYLLRDIGNARFSAALVTAGKPVHISCALVKSFADPRAMALHSLPVTLPIDNIVAGLNEVQPFAIFIYPSMLPDLVQSARCGALRIAPEVIVTGGEPLQVETRRAAEQAFAATVLNWWLSSEAGPMGIGCGHGPGLHLSDDLMIIEPVDENNEPVPEGARSAKVLVTNLYNRLFPLIRYEITDEVTVLAETCPCGSRHRLIADPQGRLDDIFQYQGRVRVHPHLFRSVLVRHPGIAEYQVRQTERGAALAIRGRADLVRLEREIEEELERAGVASPSVSIAGVGCIERQQTGKIRRFVPLASMGKLTGV